MTKLSEILLALLSVVKQFGWGYCISFGHKGFGKRGLSCRLVQTNASVGPFESL
jgi:hypothetical protein